MRLGRIESIVPDKEILLHRLEVAENLEDVKTVVADLIATVGTFVYGINERNGERVMGQLGLAGGGNVFFTDTDRMGAALRRESSLEPLYPQRDRTAESVEDRSEKARAQRVSVGKKE